MRTLLLGVAVIGVATVLEPYVWPQVSALARSSKAESAAPLPQSVTVGPAVRGQIGQRVELVGTVVPRQLVLVGVDIDGYRVVAVNVSEGDVVHAGDVLAQLGTEEIDNALEQNAASAMKAAAAVEQAKAQLDKAQSAAALATTALARAKALGAGIVLTQQVLDQRIDDMDAATALVASAKAAVDAAEADTQMVRAQRKELITKRKKTTIRAPAGGLVISRKLDIGEVVGPGTGQLFAIAQSSAFEVAAEVDATTLARLTVGQAATIDVAGLPSLAGSVRLISHTLDPATRLGTARIAVDRPTELIDGAFASVSIDLDPHLGVLVPRTAVQTGEKSSLVDVVTGGRIEERKVETGATTDSKVEITSGIEPGDMVVVRAGPFVHDGEAVRTLTAGE